MLGRGYWIGLCGLALTLTACPGDDSSGDTNNTTLNPPTTTAMGTTTDDPGTTAGPDESTGTPDPTTGPDDTTGGPVTCTPECLPGQMCVAGACIGDPTCDPPCADGEICNEMGMCAADPGACGTNVMTGNMACDDCGLAACCTEWQACFGDETVMMNTPCLELNNCIATNCGGATDLMMLEDCVDMNCPELAPEMMNFLNFNNCLFTNCQAECAG